YVVAMSAFILATGQGLLAAILLVLFIPGYVLVAALFPGSGKLAEAVRDVAHAGERPGPGEGQADEAQDAPDEGEGDRKGEIDWIERIALSFGLSIAVVPLLGLLLNFTPFGIRLTPIVLSILFFSVGLGVVAYIRRMALPKEDRLSATLVVRRPAWGEYSRLDKVLAVGLVISVVFAVSVLAFVLTTPRPGEQFTEFGILGPGGMLSGYPTDLNVSEPGTVLIFVANHEFAPVDYTVRVDQVGVEIVFNPDTGANETNELNRTTMSWMNLSLEHDTNSTSPYTFQIDTAGLYQVQFLLFRDSDLAQVYRNLHLFVTVTAP
ncbi:MAG: DUF1616 domain-containing protein, partial [Thermoplasmata archaeon]|nr:DUF1616 domain-containing protein [Thermoplasmata archaeon]